MSDATATMPEAPPAPPAPPVGGGPAAPEPPREPRRGGITAGIVLIVIGVMFLLAQFVPGVAWFNVWPLIIIVAGLIQAFTPGKEGWSVNKMFDGFVTVAVGGVFLAITTGVVGWSVWGRILTLWPVLVIAIGLDLLGKALHTTWVRILGSLAVIAGLAIAVAGQASSAPSFDWLPPAHSQPFSVAEPVGDTTEADLQLDAGVAQVRLGSGGELISLKGRSPWGTPEVNVDRSGSSAKVKVVLGGRSNENIVWPGAETIEADVALSDRVLWNAVIATGVSSLDGDLSKVPVRRLELKPGVADVDVRLGPVPQGVRVADVEVKSGVSSVVLRLPSDAQVRMESNSGLSGVIAEKPLESRGNGIWETPGYSAAAAAGDPVYKVVVKSGVGSFRLVTY